MRDSGSNILALGASVLTSHAVLEAHDSVWVTQDNTNEICCSVVAVFFSLVDIKFHYSNPKALFKRFLSRSYTNRMKHITHINNTVHYNILAHFCLPDYAIKFLLYLRIVYDF